MSRDLADLHPAFAPMAALFLADVKNAGIDLLVTCTARTNLEQAALYAQGRTAPGHIVTNAQPGQSAHNYGLAIDVVPIVNGKCVWDDSNPIWAQVGKIGVDRGLVWLGSAGSSFKESPHFQMPNWESFK